MTEISYDKFVDGLVETMSDGPDELASTCIEASIEVLIMRYGAAWTFVLFAGIYDSLAEKAVVERAKRLVELRKKFG